MGESLKQPTAVVLLSGGLDSATVLAMACEQGYRCYCLTFNYGQRNLAEIEAARTIAQTLDAFEHQVISLDLRMFGGSALTDDINVPQDRTKSEMTEGIPVTYVPARNLILLSVAAGYAESRGVNDLFIGVNSIDYSGYPDCRPQFIQSFEETVNLGTKSGAEGNRVRVHTPLISMSKASIIRTGIELGIDYQITRSCYTPDDAGRACGRCDACTLRKQGFEESGFTDPTIYHETVLS